MESATFALYLLQFVPHFLFYSLLHILILQASLFSSQRHFDYHRHTIVFHSLSLEDKHSYCNRIITCVHAFIATSTTAHYLMTHPMILDPIAATLAYDQQGAMLDWLWLNSLAYVAYETALHGYVCSYVLSGFNQSLSFQPTTLNNEMLLHHLFMAVGLIAELLTHYNPHMVC